MFRKLFTLTAIFSSLAFTQMDAATYKLSPIMEETDEVMLHRRVLMIEANLNQIEESLAMIQFYLGNAEYITPESEY